MFAAGNCENTDCFMMAHVGQKRPRTWRLDSNDIIEEDVRDITRFVVLDESNVFEVGSVEWTADILGETIVRDPLISPETISEFIGQRKIPLSRTLNRIVEARKPQLLGSIAKLSSLPIFNLCDVLETLDSGAIDDVSRSHRFRVCFIPAEQYHSFS